MKISGFTLVRNGIQFDYPFVESLLSLLPWVEEMIVNVGIGTDQTLQVLTDLSKTPQGAKLKIFESDWRLDDPEKKKGGLILSEQTNLALDRCTHDWCVYLQADEVLHEKEMPELLEYLRKVEHDPDVEGILLNYLHFYGSFDVVQKTRSAYRREVRVIRKSSGARSVGDAQSFRKGSHQGPKLKVLLSNANVYHYGWVRPPETMKEKTFFFDQLYHGSPDPQDAALRRPFTGDNYRYKKFWGLRPYAESHPAVMSERIARKGWHWDLESSPWVWSIEDLGKVVLDSFENLTGIRMFEYRSYQLIGALDRRVKA